MDAFTRLLRILAGTMLVAVSALAFGQQRFVRAGNQAFNDLAFTRAIDNYEQAAKKGVPDSTFASKLARSYYNVRDMENAERWYARAVELPNASRNDRYLYAQTLRATGQYEAADKWLRTYQQSNEDDTRTYRQARSASFVKKVNTIPGCVVKDLPLNTPGADMGPSLRGSELVFASDRSPSPAEARRHSWNDRPFLDLFTIPTSDPLGTPTRIVGVNTRYHESNASFTPDGGTMYFTRNNYSGGRKGSTPQGVVNLKIYMRSWENGSWVNERPFAYNSDDYSVGHPALSPDGALLYFTSDMPGGLGGTDIWVCKKEGEQWGKPMNMGSTLNTEGNEMFPFVASTGQVFFASDGQAGLGGLDVLVCPIGSDGVPGTPKNLGPPLNSASDDLGLVLDPTGLHGYFTSDRPGGKGDDDIYSIEVIRPLGMAMHIEGVVTDAGSRSLMQGVPVELKDGDGHLLDSRNTDASGGYAFDVEPDREYIVSCAPERCRSTGSVLRTGPPMDTTFHRDLHPARLAPVKLWLQVTNAHTHTAVGNAEVEVTDLPGGGPPVLQGATDTAGELRGALAERAVGDSLVLRVELKKQGFISRAAVFRYKLNDTNEVAVHRAMDLGLVPLGIGDEVGAVLQVNPIHFDLDRAKIRPDAAAELYKIVAWMKANPGAEIELRSHTDSRGNDARNRALSVRRARSSVAYIVSRGIAKRRIKGKGYGESRLLNKCGNGVKCTEEEHEMNRRTEFIITKL